jgi:hypothetical protein
MMIDDFLYEFRDGERPVPPHVAAMFDYLAIDTMRFTFEEAIKLANSALLQRHFDNARQHLIDEHFRLGGG